MKRSLFPLITLSSVLNCNCPSWLKSVRNFSFFSNAEVQEPSSEQVRNVIKIVENIGGISSLRIRLLTNSWIGCERTSGLIIGRPYLFLQKNTNVYTIAKKLLELKQHRRLCNPFIDILSIGLIISSTSVTAGLAFGITISNYLLKMAFGRYLDHLNITRALRFSSSLDLVDEIYNLSVQSFSSVSISSRK